MAPYPGAEALNFRRSVPRKPPYSGAWPLNFRGCCPGSHPKWSLILGPKIFCQDLHEVSPVEAPPGTQITVHALKNGRLELLEKGFRCSRSCSIQRLHLNNWA